jgi:hypothetical protein
MAYTKTIWVNGTAPAINATNLGNIETGIENVSLGVITFGDGSASAPTIIHAGDTDTGLFFSGVNTINFTNAGTESMRISSARFLGVGHTSPKSLIHINANTISPGFTAVTGANLTISGVDTTANLVQMDSFGAENQIIGRRAGGTAGTPTATQNNNLMYSIAGRGYQATTGAFTSDIARINFNAGQNFTSTAQGTYITFSTTPSSSVTIAEGMRLNQGAELLIGYTATNTTATSYKLQVNSPIFATSGTIITSDKKYKKDVLPIENALEIVKKLNPVSFNWIKHPIHNFDLNQKTVGFIAQEVHEVLKDETYLKSIIREHQSSYTNDQGVEIVEPFMGIGEGNLIAILTKAIQEQSIIINDLKTRIINLERG